jgi:hypothetical protein
MEEIMENIALPGPKALQHYLAFWRLETIDLSIHPYANRDAILSASSGMQVRTIVLQTGSIDLSNQSEPPLPDSGNKFKVVESTCSSALSLLGPAAIW